MNNKKINKALITRVTSLLRSWKSEKLDNEIIQNRGIAIKKNKDNLLKTIRTYKKTTIEYFDKSNQLALSEYF
tara:strand:+ start:59 stop:277 length:219 start_codon:yes stop_codon:yes gene_type:complete